MLEGAYARREELTEYCGQVSSTVRDDVLDEAERSQIEDLIDLLKPFSDATTHCAAFLALTFRTGRSILKYVEKHLRNVASAGAVVSLICLSEQESLSIDIFDWSEVTV